jgi:peptidyl-prolyl cis-trans isomerase SurA
MQKRKGMLKYCVVSLGLVMSLAQGVEPSAWAKAPVVLDRLEASVNSSIILLSDVKKFRDVAPLRAQLDPLFAGTPLAAQGKNSSQTDIVNFLVDKKIISQQFPKTDNDVEQEINSIQANNHLDRAGLKSALAREGYEFPDYFELIRSSSETRELIEREIRPKVTISDDDIKNYFYNHYARSSNTPRAFHIKIITMSTKSYKTPGAASQFANQALKDIRSGESFEEVAKRVSDDASSASGGDLGVLTEDQMSSAIRDQIKKLQVGQISPVLGGESTGRYFILKLVGIKTDDSEQLAKKKEEIRAQLASVEYQHQIKLWLERQRQSAFIHRAGESSLKEIPLKQ